MSTAPTAQEQFDEQASKVLTAVYLTPDVVAQRAGADDIKIFLVLKTEDDSRHLLHQSVHDLKLRRQREVIELFPLIDAHGKMFVFYIPARLGQHDAVRCPKRFIHTRQP